MEKYAELAKFTNIPWVYFERERLNCGYEWVACSAPIPWNEAVNYRLRDLEGNAVEACLVWELNSKCPLCQGANDLSQSPHDDNGDFSGRIFHGNANECSGTEVICEHCNHTYVISEVIY